MSPLDRTQRPTGKPTIAAQIEAQLRREILHGDLAPGSRLNLDELRKRLDVGLSPLREAVTRLVSDGLVQVAPHSGYSVSPISVGNLREVSALRLELEPFALRLSIANASLDWEVEVMAALHRLNRTERRPGDAESLVAWEDANNAFHAALISRCGMPLLLRIHGGLTAMNDRYRLIYLKAAGVQREVIEEHIAIAGAALNRQSDEAVTLLKRHIERSTANLSRLISEDLPGAEG